MKKIFLIIYLLTISLFAEVGVYLQSSTFKPNYTKNFDTTQESKNFSNQAIGVNFNNFIIEVEMFKDTVDYIGANFGYLGYSNIYDSLDFLYKFSFGFGSASTSSTRDNIAIDDSPSFNLAGSIGLGYTISKNFRIELLTGYKKYDDMSDSTICNDGTTSDSTGSGTCSWHGGINHYVNPIGDMDGFQTGIGLTYFFDK